MSNYAKADTKTQWFAGAWPGSAIAPNCGVIHTTEGTSWDGYDGGAKAPNYTALPRCRQKTLEFRAHFPDEMSSRALRNESGGVETNTLNCVQIELIGTCARATRDEWVKEGLTQNVDFIFWPEAPAWALHQVADFIADMNKRHGIPISGPRVWLPYPASYGLTNPNRFSASVWRAFKGWCGHQHVPENDHGDPGAINWVVIEELARRKAGGQTVPQTRGRLADQAEQILTQMAQRAKQNGRVKRQAAVERWLDGLRRRYPLR